MLSEYFIVAIASYHQIISDRYECHNKKNWSVDQYLGPDGSWSDNDIWLPDDWLWIHFWLEPDVNVCGISAALEGLPENPYSGSQIW